MSTPSVLLPACGNWIPGVPPCERQGERACGNCLLLVYCGPECQKAHWPQHKKVCKSPMSKESWRPAWDLEGREPPWAATAVRKNLHNPFGENKYLWGNTPALDVLNLEQNEGLGHQEDLSLLFAASGDWRHVVKTIASLPDGITHQIRITMNDLDFHVVARNTILLLLALTTTSTSTIEQTAEVLIHVWYSSSIPSSVMSTLQDRVKPLIAEVCKKIANKSPDSILGKTWDFPAGQTFRLVLKKKDWLQLLGFFEVPEGLSWEEAARIRKAVTLAPERVDYRDRWYFKETLPFMRIAKQRFQEDGMLLPFGHPRIGFNTPNPTLFRNSKTWPMDDKSEPSCGWPIMDVQRTSSPAPRDWYGKLFVHLHEVLRRFQGNLKKVRVNFVLYNVNVKELPQHLHMNKYSRIETANICDGGYLGIRNTLDILSPFLQSPRENPHATFITTFINAVKEAVKRGNPMDENPNMEFLLKYLAPPRIMPFAAEHDANMLRIWDARDSALDADKFFDRYMKFCNFEQLSVDLGVEMKATHTVIEKWPTQLKLKPGEQGAEEEFRLMLGSNFSGVERYVEWRRSE
ncbi:uncharacterized protein PAC_00158 [Phialocephala subalpina]|uniref:MYND-type domain-containing protein n=1 Tax=Phialocephala subalpina TaxID=576137 RepID=A0A1L7WBY0_9HELO|nr:uncharacterized protein PAC_00158 [Phialocephala subalpina]